MPEECRLCRDYRDGSNTVFETDNFFVVPALGQLGLDGYLMICTKAHLVGAVNIPTELLPEFESCLERTRLVVSHTYSSEVLVFEHGPKLACARGGACIDHAHLHFVPTVSDVMEFLNEQFEPRRLGDLSELREICERDLSYVMVETQERERHVVELDIPAPAQFLRQLIAEDLGVKNWDWRDHPDLETFASTTEALKGSYFWTIPLDVLRLSSCRIGAATKHLYMMAAIAEARRSSLGVKAGAVVVKDGQIVGRGFRQVPTAEEIVHAEHSALRDAGEAARGATLYCTLEPCSGGTSNPSAAESCAELIAGSGIECVVVGVLDGDPKIRGRGVQRLVEDGVRVEWAHLGLYETLLSLVGGSTVDAEATRSS
jgi:pyrimidine deaminase RibD-like protein